MKLQHKDKLVEKLVEELENLEDHGEVMTPEDYNNTKGWVECLKWMLGLHSYQQPEYLKGEK
tara:strand:+ start:1684 stop:1869 length:186 start_codon:yes stop_codon:yes gene_type:complete